LEERLFLKRVNYAGGNAGKKFLFILVKSKHNQAEPAAQFREAASFVKFRQLHL
jgi:hypothetical protein